MPGVIEQIKVNLTTLKWQKFFIAVNLRPFFRLSTKSLFKDLFQQADRRTLVFHHSV